MTDDNILDTINKKTAAQNRQFLSARHYPSGNIVLQTNPTTSADQGAALAMEIAAALDSITIESRSIRANSRWTSFVNKLESHGSGTIIVSFPGKIENLGISTIALFNRRCRFEKALPSSRNTQCHKCQQYGHRQTHCQKDPKCGVCAAAHATTSPTGTTPLCTGGAKCNHTPIRCANCQLGPAGNHKAKDRSCPTRAKAFLNRGTGSNTALQ
ncbi:hypothetical protein Q9L58_010060 [Maublancomyces gigas]|uniref:Gag protein n=1 Tax=Discina gigas TaxID=1032678 RepID=A0ABR3G566_9PEZI